MKLGPTRALTAAVLAIACGCRAPQPYKQPPAGSYTSEPRQVTIGESVTSIQGAAVTQDFFRAAEVRPLLGRLFVDGDHVSSAQGVVILSHDLWTDRFNSSPEIIGRNIEIDGRRTVVIGITPRGFRFPEGTRLWTPKDSGAR